MTAVKGEFIECQNCGFVLLAANLGDPTPLNRETCPDCDGTNFSIAGP